MPTLTGTAFQWLISNSVDGVVYLHRDYLGSVLAITNENGGVEEQRQFGAWGRVDRFKKSSKDSVFDHQSILNRGYTGHEHFFEVSLIHMNGRMYDAQLGRFLSPDNFVQDPYNTQNFNRYGYVLNNPLVFNDPSGEIIPLLAIAAGAVIGAYLGGTQANGTFNPFKWDWKSTKTIVGIFGGAAIGVATGGLGTAVAGAVAPLLGTTAGTVLGSGIIGSVSGAVSGFFGGGLMEFLPGGSGNFMQGAVRGFVGGAVLGFAMGTISGIWKGLPWKNAPVRTPVSKVPTVTKPIAGLDNELVIDADVVITPKPATPSAPSGNSTTSTLNKAVKDSKGLVELNIKGA